MADVLITYDVDSKHIEVKKKMKALGYADYVMGGSGKPVYLPNTTLWKTNTTPKDAVDHLRGTCDGLRVNLERAIATPFADWYALYGKPHEE